MNDSEIFHGKTFSSLLKDIYDNSKEKDVEIKKHIKELVNLIKKYPSHAGAIIPNIKDLLEVSIKNDEQLIKMAGIVQRILGKTKRKSVGYEITEDELSELMDAAEEAAKHYGNDK